MINWLACNKESNRWHIFSTVETLPQSSSLVFELNTQLPFLHFPPRWQNICMIQTLNNIFASQALVDIVINNATLKFHIFSKLNYFPDSRITQFIVGIVVEIFSFAGGLWQEGADWCRWPRALALLVEVQSLICKVSLCAVLADKNINYG